MDDALALPLAAFSPLDWGIVATYLLAMVALGLASFKKRESAESFFLSSRNLPTWAIAISLVATTLSAATFVGVPDLAYGGDLSYLVLNVGGFLAVFIVILLFVPPLYRAGTITIYGYIARRYGETSRIAVSVMFLLGRLLASGSRLFIASVPLCMLMFAQDGQGAFSPTPLQQIFAIALIGIIGTFYTTLGGIRTVVWTDVIQFTLVIGAAIASIAFLLYRIDLPVSQLWNTLSSAGKLNINTSMDFRKSFSLASALFGTTFLVTATYGVDHDFAQRFLISRSAIKGAMSIIWGQIIGLGAVILFLALGLLLWVFYSHLKLAPGHGGDGVYPWFLLNEMPPVLSGLAIVGFFAIAQGSLDSAINAMASSAVADIYMPLRARCGGALNEGEGSSAPKIAVVLMGAIMVGFAMLCVTLYGASRGGLIEFALGVMSFALSGMLAVFLTALLTPRGNTWSVIAALVTGVVVTALLQPPIMKAWTRAVSGAFGEAREWTIPGTYWIGIATTAAFVVCLLGKSKNKVHPQEP